MEKIIKKEYLINKSIKVISINDIVNNLDKISISCIQLNQKQVLSGTNVKVIYEKTDYEHPIVLKSYDFTDDLELFINLDWYIDNIEVVNKLIEQIILNSKNKSFDIGNSCLINSNIIDCLCKNNFIMEVELDKYSENGYILSQDDYLKFKNSNVKKVNSKGVSEELKENFDPIIGYNDRFLISYYKYNDLASDIEKNIYLNKILSEEELNNFKYLSNKKTIKLQEENITNFSIICEKLKSLGKNNKVVLDIKNKNEFNSFIFSQDISYENLFVCVNNYDIPIKKYLILEKLLYTIIEPVKNLSSFEKYIYAYNISKRYKRYNENKDNKNESRNLYDLLENEYMVCVGFSSLFGDLLDKLEIPNQELGISVDTSYDNITNEEEIKPEEKIINYAGHSRRRIYLTDEKYGIDGIYIADPTWDNDLENDYYNHLIMTDNEVTKARRFIKMNLYNVHELFNIGSIEEFYSKINFLLDKGKTLKWLGHQDIKSIVKDIIDNIKVLDNNYYNELKSKYNCTFTSSYDYPNDVTELLADIGKYLVNHVNKEISGNTIMKAVEEVYRKCNIFPEEQIEFELEKTKQLNKDRQEKCFPPRHKYYKDGNVEYDIEWYNKFDIDCNEKVI